MKKIFVTTIALLLISCNSKSDKKEATQPQENSVADKVDTLTVANFDSNKIPLSDKNLGEFPYLNPPENYCYGSCSNYTGKINEREVKAFDKEYFAVNGKLSPIEGKSFKTIIEKNKSKESSPYNTLIVEKSLENAILDLGGVQVNSVPVAKSEIERIGDKDLYEKVYGHSLDPNLLDDIKTFVIRTKDKELWIQYCGYDDASGRLTILEKGLLKTEKVEQINSSQMKKDIDNAGKTILNINFDTDKATLKPEGKEIVDEILKLLNDNSTLKLAIQGHTDNSGSPDHNNKLSLERTNTIKNYLTINGINAYRLKTQGFGQEKPLVPNDTEANKAKNRRVELVKF